MTFDPCAELVAWQVTKNLPIILPTPNYFRPQRPRSYWSAFLLLTKWSAASGDENDLKGFYQQWSLTKNLCHLALRVRKNRVNLLLLWLSLWQEEWKTYLQLLTCDVQICSVFDARQKNRQIDKSTDADAPSFLLHYFWDFHCISQTNVLLIILIWQAWCKQGKKRTPDRRLGAWLKTSDGTMRNGWSC